MSTSTSGTGIGSGTVVSSYYCSSLVASVSSDDVSSVSYVVSSLLFSSDVAVLSSLVLLSSVDVFEDVSSSVLSVSGSASAVSAAVVESAVLDASSSPLVAVESCSSSVTVSVLSAVFS